MPVFYFHLRMAEGVEPDEAGLDFPDLEAAYLDLCDGLPALLGELVRQGRDPAGGSFAIANGAGEVLLEVPLLGELVRGRPRRPSVRPPAPVDPALAAARRLLERTRAAGRVDAECRRASAAALARSYALLRQLRPRSALLRGERDEADFQPW